MKSKYFLIACTITICLNLINSFPQKLENNSELTILSNKENRYFYFEVPGEGSTLISIKGKGDSDSSALYINESCSKNCISKDVDQPSERSYCDKRNNDRYNFISLTSTEKCIIFIGVSPKTISLGIVLNIKFEPILETNKGFENYVDVNYEFYNDYKYFSYTFDSNKKGNLNIYVKGISDSDVYSINYTSDCSFCPLKNIKFPNRDTYYGQTGNDNYNVIRIVISGENCKIYFSIFSSRVTKGAQLRVRFDELKNMDNLNEFNLIQADKNAYRYFSFKKEKSMGQGLIWIFAKSLNGENLNLYSANTSDTCKITDDFIMKENSCDSTQSNNSQILNYYYTDPNSEDRIRFSVVPYGSNGFYLKTLFIPLKELKIDEDYIKFTALDNNSYNFFKIPVGQEFIGSKLTISVMGESRDEENYIYITTEKRENDCPYNDVIFPKYKRSCYSTSGGYKNEFTFSVKQSTTLYVGVYISKNYGGSLIRVLSDKKLLFLSESK